MKTIRWWVLGAILTAAGLAVLGPVVFGQQEPSPIRVPAPLPLPVPPPVPPPAAPPPLVPAVTPPSMPVPVMAPKNGPGLEPVEIPHSDVKPVPVTAPESPSVGLPASLKQESITTTTARKASTLETELRLGRQEPAVSIEWSGPPMVRLNQPMTCQLLVRNTSGVAVHNVVVRHRPSQGVTYRASEPQPTVDEGDLVWSLGTLAAGQVRRIDLQMVVQIKGPLTCQATVTFSGAASHQVQVSEPQIRVRLKAPERVLSAEPVTLLYTVSNPGDGPAETVKLRTILPEGLEHQHGRAIEVDLGTLASKESRTLQLVCTARGSGTQKCQAVATAEGGLSSVDEAPLEIIMPKLDLALVGPKLRYIDRKATYVLKVTNPGSAPATNVVVHGVVPATFKYHGTTASGVYDEATRTATWVLGDLQPGQSREFALEMVPSATGEHRVTAQVSSARGLKTDAETRTVVEGLPALLIEVVDTDDPVEVGADTTYEVRVANIGTKTESNVQVVCTLPEQVEFRSAKGGTNLHHSIEGREVTFEPVAKLAPRADVVYRVQVRGKTAGDVRFRVRVRADGLAEPILREESTRFYNDEVLAK
jgi:uncharacterized repeat protein (TIGR01451 family)